MSILKCSISATENATHFKLYQEKDENFKNEAFKVFVAPENQNNKKFKIKIKVE